MQTVQAVMSKTEMSKRIAIQVRYGNEDELMAGVHCFKTTCMHAGIQSA